MAKLERVRATVSALGRMAADPGKASARVVVGYATSYAGYVHENMQAAHPVGNAKFLERPARRMAPAIGRRVGQLVRQGVPFPQALYAAALELQAESQRQCPVDTGALRNSAFTRPEA